MGLKGSNRGLPGTYWQKEEEEEMTKFEIKENEGKSKNKPEIQFRHLKREH